MLARIERLNPKLNAYLTVTTELALAQAKKAEIGTSRSSRRKSIVIAARSTASPSR